MKRISKIALSLAAVAAMTGAAYADHDGWRHHDRDREWRHHDRGNHYGWNQQNRGNNYYQGNYNQGYYNQGYNTQGYYNQGYNNQGYNNGRYYYNQGRSNQPYHTPDGGTVYSDGRNNYYIPPNY